MNFDYWSDNCKRVDSENLNQFLGVMFDEVYRDPDNLGGNEALVLENKQHYLIFVHNQDCCESVTIEDIAGDLKDLESSPLTMCELSSNSDGEGRIDPSYPNCRSESFTWTYLNLATQKGYVSVRFYGESNGYYSEDVDVFLVRK